MNAGLKNILRALGFTLWVALLTLPLLGTKYNTATKSVSLQLDRTLMLLVPVFLLALFWHWYFTRKSMGQAGLGVSLVPAGIRQHLSALGARWRQPKVQTAVLLALLACFLVLPTVSSIYQVTIFALALIYIMLALGLNIVVGLAGQLGLGYSAFYAVGAYTYALLFQYFGWGFWTCLPLGGVLATLAGLALGFPVLRLRGDYLAIVTLGFGEITRLLLTNFSDFTGGARGVSNIPRPSFFGMNLSLEQSTIYIYYLALAAAVITIIVVSRLKNSRVGLALQALREDEIACEAMGIDLRKTKLAAFALGSCWAGFAGVLLAARNNFINPASFTFLDSAMILSMVVLGGMGSISGVVLAALLLTLLPEYLRAFSEYRMLIFGAIMVLMMIFRPQGMIPSPKRSYKLSGHKTGEGEKA